MKSKRSWASRVAPCSLRRPTWPSIMKAVYARTYKYARYLDRSISLSARILNSLIHALAFQLVLTFASILKISKITTGLLNHKSILVETADAKVRSCARYHLQHRLTRSRASKIDIHHLSTCINNRSTDRP